MGKPHLAHQEQNRRTSVTDKRKGNTCVGKQIDHHRNVKNNLKCNMRIFSHIAIQVILNVAVVVNLIPNTGITLPFISYGGTSVLFLMIEMGIALGVSRKIKIEE